MYASASLFRDKARKMDQVPSSTLARRGFGRSPPLLPQPALFPLLLAVHRRVCVTCVAPSNLRQELGQCIGERESESERERDSERERERDRERERERESEPCTSSMPRPGGPPATGVPVVQGLGTTDSMSFEEFWRCMEHAVL